MAYKGGFVILNKILKDVKNNDRVMGGVTVLLADTIFGKLCQQYQEELVLMIVLKACIKASYIWPLIQKLSLTKNMRVYLRSDIFAGTFSELLKMGNGQHPESEGKLIIPAQL